MFLLIIFNGVHRDFRRLSLRKSKHACRNTAERNTLADVFLGKLQAGEVTAFQQLTILFVSAPLTIGPTVWITYLQGRL